MRKTDWIAFTALIAPVCLHAQATLSAPLLGLFSTGSEVRPLNGVVGSSMVGGQIALPLATGRVYLAPGQQWALVEDGLGGSMGRMPFNGAAPGAVTPISGALATASAVSFSPSGRSAAIYSASSGKLQVVTGLDSTPTVGNEFDVSALNVAAAAVSDDGTLPVVMTTGGAVYLLSASGPSQIFAAGWPAGIAFLPGQTLAIVEGAGGTVTVLGGLAGQPAIQRVIPGPQLSGNVLFVGTSSDGNTLLITPEGGQSAYGVNLNAASVVSIALPASVSRFDPIAPNLFLFSADSGRPGWLLYFDGAVLRAGFAQSNPSLAATAKAPVGK